MNTVHDWLPVGSLGERTSEDVMRQLLRLARSERPEDTEDLLEVAATKGLRFPRIAMDAAMKERDVARHEKEKARDAALDEQEVKRLAEVRRLERFLAAIAAVTCLAAIMQAVAAVSS